METAELTQALDAYLDAHADDIITDIARLVEIPSVEDLPHAAPGAPYGPGPARALEAGLALAARLGMQPHNMDGYVGYADLPAAEHPETARNYAMIGHMDVVDAGPGWTFDPWSVTRHEGYLVGRGVQDDKGPLVIAMHALNFWREQGMRNPADALPYNMRVIVGANEETTMRDVDYYRAHMADPDFLFTPDAEFPVGYGEKGIYHARLVSAPIAHPGLVALVGGAAVNAVPGEARATLASGEDLFVQGRSAHASTPQTGKSAILGLIDELLGEHAGQLTAEERDFLALDRRLTSSFDGAGAGIACADEDFGALTMVGGTISLEDEAAGEDGQAQVRIVQTIDIRYPTAITAEQITARLSAAAGECGAAVELDRVEVPFLTSPDSPEVQALIAAYRDVTGDVAAEPFTMGGGTYARKFTRAVSFGAEMPWVELPAWAGGMHGANEVMSEELLRTAFRVYAVALDKLR